MAKEDEHDPKNPNRVKQTIIYLVWGLVAMMIVVLLMLLAAYLGWGV